MKPQTRHAAASPDVRALGTREVVGEVASSLIPILLLGLMTGVPLLFAAMVAKRAAVWAIAARVGALIRRAAP